MSENGKLWGKTIWEYVKIIIDPQKYFIFKNLGVGIQNTHVQIQFLKYQKFNRLKSIYLLVIIIIYGWHPIMKKLPLSLCKTSS